MKHAGQVGKLFLGIFGVLGMVLLTSCETGSNDDLSTVMVVNQTGEPLAMYVDDAESPELTVAAHATQILFPGSGTHQVKWQGTTIQGVAEITLPENESRTLTLWGSGNAYSVK